MNYELIKIGVSTTGVCYGIFSLLEFYKNNGNYNKFPFTQLFIINTYTLLLTNILWNRNNN